MGTAFIGRVSQSDAFRAATDLQSGTQSTSFTTIREFWKQEGVIPLDTAGNTILHYLAMYGNNFVFQKLLNDNGVVTNQDLILKNHKGNTPLHEAVRFGQKRVVEILLRKEEALFLERNDSGETPLYVAAACGKKDIFNLLSEKLHSNSVMTRSDKQNVLHAALMGEYYSLSMSILESFPLLAQNPDEKGRTALDLLSQKPLSFRSGSLYSLENYLAGSLIFSLKFLAVVIYWIIPQTMMDQRKHAGDVENQQKNPVNNSKPKGLLVTKLLSVFPCIREICDEKRKHGLAKELGKRLVNIEREWISRYSKRENLGSPLFQATENGIIELVKEILGKFPEAAYGSCDHMNGMNILHIAVEKKHRQIYNFLKKEIVFKDAMLGEVDNQQNTILHLAAELGTGRTGRSRSVQRGHWNQMTWDVCWFKHVGYDSPPHLWYLENSEGETATEAFERHHSDIRGKAEKTLKEMNNGLMLISTLIGTVNFAALLTPPGGYNENESSKFYGIPVFLHFAVSDMLGYFTYISMALFASFVALAGMLTIQSCPFRSNDFYVDLPLRFLLAITTMGFAIAFTIAAAMQAYLLDNIDFDWNVYMWPACVGMAIIYIDAAALTFYYLYFVFFKSLLHYKGQDM